MRKPREGISRLACVSKRGRWHGQIHRGLGLSSPGERAASTADGPEKEKRDFLFASVRVGSRSPRPCLNSARRRETQAE